MGAVLDGRVYLPEPRKGSTGKGAAKTEREIREEIQTRFRRDTEADAAENGMGGYSGHIGQGGGGIGRFMDLAFEDGTLRKDAKLRYAIEEYLGDDIDLNRKYSAREKAWEYIEAVAGKRDDAIAVSFVYSPGKGMKKRKGWVVGMMCGL